jgi:hypothetical protein
METASTKKQASALDLLAEQEEAKVKALGGIYAGRDQIFAVRYTLDIDKKQFYPFYAIGYKSVENIIEFIEAKVPGNIMGITVMPILHQFGQTINAPSLDRRLATIFIYKAARPKWFDKTEEFVLNSIKDTSPDANVPMNAFDGLVNPLITQVLKKS